MTGRTGLSSQDATQELAAWLTGRLPALPADRAQALVEQACGRCPGVLLEYVRARPAALADPGPRPPLAAVRLAHALHQDGHRGITLPRCARCGRSPARFPTSRPEGRICARCADQDRLRACVRCGRKRPAHARSADGPVCSTCYTRPARLCEACGQLRPLARRASTAGPAICDRCAGQAGVGTCISCGRQRPVLLRRADGKTYCKTCYPRAARKCARCGRLRPVSAEWPIGPVCDRCYSYVRKNPARCPRCGQLAALVGLDGQHPVCGPCAGWRNPAFNCHSCGAPDMLEYGRCARCVLASTLEALLDDAGPVPAGQLGALAEALQAAPRPRVTLRWLRHRRGGMILAGLAAGREPITHDLLDQMPSSHALHFLRDRLVSTGVLPERPEYLDRIPPWADQVTAGKPDGHARLVRTYAQWDALRRARRRLGPRATAGQAQKVRSKIRVASAFLDWLAGHGRDLAAAGQADLDLWLVTRRPDLARDLSPFLSWARQRRLCGPLTIPRRPRTEPLPGLPGDQRWHHLRACLAGDTTLPLAARAAAAMTLLYGAPLTQVLALRTTDVLTISGRSHLRLGQHPVLLPPAMVGLIRRQAAEADARPPAPDGNRWLFPGRADLRPITAQAMTRQLNRHGIHLRAGRHRRPHRPGRAAAPRGPGQPARHAPGHSRPVEPPHRQRLDRLPARTRTCHQPCSVIARRIAADRCRAAARRRRSRWLSAAGLPGSAAGDHPVPPPGPVTGSVLQRLAARPGAARPARWPARMPRR